MTQQVINVGTVTGDGTGDKGQVPGTKINANMTELYTNAVYLGIDSGVVNALVVATNAYAPAPATGVVLLPGVMVRVIPLVSNTAASTLNFAGTGVRPIINTLGQTLTGGEIIAGTAAVFIYNGTSWVQQLVSIAAIANAANGQTAQEALAGVTPANPWFSTDPYDIRRYSGWNGDGITDDSGAHRQLAAVLAAGSGAAGYIPAGKTYISSEVIWTPPGNGYSALFGYGATIYTNNIPNGGAGPANAIDGMQFVNGGGQNGMAVYGIRYAQVDATASNGFYLNGASNIYLRDCGVDISSTVAANSNFACAQVYSTGVGGFGNTFENFFCRQASGNATFYPPCAILLNGQANATRIRGCSFGNVNVGVNISCITGPNAANGVTITESAFESIGTAVFVNGASIAGSHFEGIVVAHNRMENITGQVLLLQNINQDASEMPIYLEGNFPVGATVAAYVVQSGNTVPITVVAHDPWRNATLGSNGINTTSVNYGPHLFYNIASTGGNYDVINAVPSSTGGGIILSNPSGTVLASIRSQGTYAVMNLPTTAGAYQVNGTQVVGQQIAGYGTPTGGSHQPSFAAGSITLANLAACVAQMIIDLKDHGLLGS